MSGIAAQERADLVMRWIRAWGFRPRLTQPRSLLRILPKKDRGLRFDPNPPCPSSPTGHPERSRRHHRQGQAGSEASTGHHGYQRACVLISGQASNGPFGSPVFVCAGKTDPPSRLILSQTSAGNGTMSSFSPDQCSSFVRAMSRSFVPACTSCGAPRTGRSRLAALLAATRRAWP